LHACRSTLEDPLVEALYSDQDELEIETTITYQDGRTALIKTRLHIEEIDDPTVSIPTSASRVASR
jgi:hypothetical protein